MDPDWFAGRLKELREAAGLTQQQLADKADMKKSGVQNIEQGRTYPEWPTVVKLCAALGVDCGSFMVPPSDREPAGPGRPKKAEAESQMEKPKRGRGRPKKGK